MCSPGVFHINKFEMAEFGKLYLNLEQVSTEVLGLLYSCTDWELLLFFSSNRSCPVKSSPSIALLGAYGRD